MRSNIQTHKTVKCICTFIFPLRSNRYPCFRILRDNERPSRTHNIKNSAMLICNEIKMKLKDNPDELLLNISRNYANRARRDRCSAPTRVNFLRSNFECYFLLSVVYVQNWTMCLFAQSVDWRKCLFLTWGVSLPFLSSNSSMLCSRRERTLSETCTLPERLSITLKCAACVLIFMSRYLFLFLCG